MKVNTTQLGALYTLKQAGGVIKSSDWTHGHGRYTTSRIVPPFCEKIARIWAYKYPLRIQRFFKNHPRVQAVIAITDMKAVNKALKGSS